MDETTLASSYEQNFARYILAVNKMRKQTQEESFSLLYQAWGCGTSYERLEDFCTDALGWRREDLTNLFSEAQMRHFSMSSGTKSSTPSPTKVSSTRGSPPKSNQSSPFNFDDKPSTSVNFVPGFEGAHLLRSSTMVSSQMSNDVRIDEIKVKSGTKSSIQVMNSKSKGSPHHSDPKQRNSELQQNNLEINSASLASAIFSGVNDISQLDENPPESVLSINQENCHEVLYGANTKEMRKSCSPNQVTEEKLAAVLGPNCNDISNSVNFNFTSVSVSEAMPENKVNHHQVVEKTYVIEHHLDKGNDIDAHIRLNSNAVMNKEPISYMEALYSKAGEDSCVTQGQKASEENSNVTQPEQALNSISRTSLGTIFLVRSSNEESRTVKDAKISCVLSDLDVMPDSVPTTEVKSNLGTTQIKQTLNSQESSPTKSAAEISHIIKDAVQMLNFNPDDPLSFSNHIDINQTNFLCAEPDPSQLPEKVLILLLTEIFPNMPPKIINMVRRLKHLAYVVCYLDYKFNSELLKLMLQELFCASCDLISLVVDNCKNVTEKHIKEISNKLRISKRRLRSAKKNYEDHMNWVHKTRNELLEAERELMEAQDKSDKVVKDIALCPTTSVSGVKEDIDDDVFSLQNDDNSLQENAKSRSSLKGCADSGNISVIEHSDDTAIDLDGPPRKNSLLSNVMKEVAVIQRKHSSSAEEKMRRLLRNTRQSIIMTKKSVRDRLDTNVSAEQESIAKEDKFNERQLETNRLTKKLKRLRKTQKIIDEDEKSFKTHIKDYTDGLPSTELDSEMLKQGVRCVEAVRSSRHGRLLIGSRREAVEFANRVRIFDLGEWLLRKKYAKQEVQRVYSLLHVKDCEESIPLEDLLKSDGTSPSVIFLCGPKGSGKTCMCHFILYQWKSSKYSTNSKVFEFDLVLYTTLNNILSSGSWSQYLREHVFGATLNDFTDADIHESLNSLTVLFLLDVGSLTSSGLAVLEDIFQNLGRNKIIVTCRTGSETELVAAARNNDISFIQAKLSPLSREAITEFSSTLFSKEELRGKDVKHFADVIDSMKVTDSLLYPLHLTYLVYLWSIDPGCVVHSTSVSRLFTQVILLCQQLMMKQSKPGEIETVRTTSEKYSNELCKASWKLMTQENWPEELAILLDSENDLDDPQIINHYHPLLVIREGPNGKQQRLFPHYCIAEILCSYYLASKLVFPRKGFVQRRPKLDVYFIPTLQRYRDVFPHIAGALIYNKHSLENSREIVSLYRKALVSELDVIAWLALLRECDFLPSMCSSVSLVVSQQSTWSVASNSGEKNCAVADLLHRGAYHPKLVVLANVLPKRSVKGCGLGVDCIIRALATCASTLVHLRQELQFYSWGEKTTCDAQVIPLQPPGTLQDCWGHLGNEGAMALRHSHHLEELNVRISSCEALTALSHSLAHLRQNLRYLYLRLDLPTSTPAESLQPLKFKGKKLWLRVRGIKDTSVTWVIDITKKLSSWYSEIVLEESRLSPPILHSLKKSLPNTPVHVSG